MSEKDPKSFFHKPEDTSVSKDTNAERANGYFHKPDDLAGPNVIDTESSQKRKKLETNDKEIKKSGKPKNVSIIIGISALVIMVALIVTLVVISFGKRKSEETTTNVVSNTTANTPSGDKTTEAVKTTEETTKEDNSGGGEALDVENASDVEKYFNANTKVLSVVSFDKAVDVKTGKETDALLTGRGFDQYFTLSDYDDGGNPVDETLEVGDSTKKYPVYNTLYMTDNDEMWNIYVLNNEIMAYPITYNVEYDAEVYVIFTESDSMVSYDFYSKCYYETIPKDKTAILIKVDKITADEISSWNAERIVKYVEQ